MIVTPTMDVVRDGVLIGYGEKLGSGSGGVSTRKNLNGSLALPIATITIIATLQMVFTNPIMTTHVNRTTNGPLMNSMVAKGYKNVDAMNPKRGYQKPCTVIAPIFHHINDHYVRPNKVALKYPNFKKDVDPNVHVKVFNSILKTNVETSEKYIINVFSYMLKDITSN
jgi:hypothetical protein